MKAFLPHLKTWLEQHDYPFEFSTEASLNLADDEELLQLMRDANFFAVFVGIESPDTETLKQMRKKQNTRRNIAESIHRIYAHGMFVTAGFIVGFDSEKGSVAEPMIDLIEETAIPVAMVGLLYALSSTQLGRRLAKEGRLHAGHDVQVTGDGDQCTAGINFDTLRPRADVLGDYRRVLQEVYDPVAFAGRLKRLSAMLDRSKGRREPPAGDIKLRAGALATVHKIISQMPEVREIFWQTFTECAASNPKSVRFLVLMMAIYLHVGPFSRKVIATIDRQIAGLHNQPPPRRAVALEPAAAAM